jgi:hypothetical protein
VIYLTSNSSGATRVIKDGQEHLDVYDRNHSDWSQRSEDWQILYDVLPEIGKMFIFDHRLCHDVEQYDGLTGDRIIIRGDIIYAKVAEN